MGLDTLGQKISRRYSSKRRRYPGLPRRVKLCWVGSFSQGSYLPKPCKSFMKNLFYTYAYLREDGTPYYIGKGRGGRAFKRGSRAVQIPPRERILFLKTGLTEEEAFKHEVYMIALYGRKDIGTGILWNFTDGGEGPSGVIRNTEFRQRVSATQKGRVFSDEHRQKISEAKKGQRLSEETKKKISKTLTGNKLSEKTKQKMAQSQLARWKERKKEE
jgi:hypothetical protein